MLGGDRSEEGVSNMWQDLSTKVHSVRELMAWLDEQRDAEPPPPEPERSWDPVVTSVMQAPQLEAILALEQREQPVSHVGASVSGSIAAFHIVELLQALVGDERAGILTLHDGAHTLRVYLHSGRVVAALHVEDEGLPPIQVLRHAAAMRTGEFEFAPQEAMEYPSHSAVAATMVQLLIELSAVAWGNGETLEALHDPPSAEQGPFGSLTEEFLMADPPPPPTVTTRRMGEMGVPPPDERTLIVRAAMPSLRSPVPVELPPLPSLRGGVLRLAHPLTAPLRDLSPLELDVLQAVHSDGTATLIESSHVGGPHQVRPIVSALVARGYLVED